MAHTGLQPDRASGMGMPVDGQRPLRSALHLRHLWDGAVLHAHRHWNVCAALETARDSAAVSVHGLSLAACNLCSAGNLVDNQYDRRTSQRSARGHDHRAARSAGVPVLEAATPQKTGLTPLTNRILSKARLHDGQRVRSPALADSDDLRRTTGEDAVPPLDEDDSIAGHPRLLRQTSAYQLYPQFHGANFTPRSFRSTTQFANLVRFLGWGREFDFKR